MKKDKQKYNFIGLFYTNCAADWSKVDHVSRSYFLFHHIFGFYKALLSVPRIPNTSIACKNVVSEVEGLSHTGSCILYLINELSYYSIGYS